MLAYTECNKTWREIKKLVEGVVAQSLASRALVKGRRVNNIKTRKTEKNKDCFYFVIYMFFLFQGQAFFLNDGRSVMSLNNALMWAKVNAFSLVGAGVRLEPFWRMNCDGSIVTDVMKDVTASVTIVSRNYCDKSIDESSHCYCLEGCNDCCNKTCLGCSCYSDLRRTATLSPWQRYDSCRRWLE